MATVHNPNNWHWVEKNCVPWAKEYFDENLYKVSVPPGEYKISVKSINSVSGDCDVTQRKGKVKCLFELKVEFVVLVVNGEGEEEEEVTIVLPEFEHDYDESDFNFEVRTSKLPYKTAVRKQFLPLAVKEVFLKFQPDLIASHEVGMKHNTD